MKNKFQLSHESKLRYNSNAPQCTIAFFIILLYYMDINDFRLQRNKRYILIEHKRKNKNINNIQKYFLTTPTSAVQG